MKLITKKILLIILPVLLNACAYDGHHYTTAPYNVNVKPSRPYYPNQQYVKPSNKKHHDSYDYFVKPAYNNEHHNEHHDHGKHEGHHGNKKNHD
jgi:hypothetical protein